MKTTKHKILIASIPFLIFTNHIIAQDFGWVNSIGGTTDDECNNIGVDGDGNVYVSGYFEGVVDFDPGTGEANLTSLGSNDLFFAKYDQSGNYIWAQRIGSMIQDDNYSMVVDEGGHVYITGNIQGAADFDPGPNTAYLIGGSFFAKYDSSGNYVWVKGIFGSYPRSITVDASGNVYLTGAFSGTTDFDPDTGAANLSTTGSSDVFFAKYDLSGNYIWAKSINCMGSSIAFDIEVDTQGDVYIAGYFSESADFDPGPDTASLTSTPVSFTTSPDAFFAKYDSLGNYIWAKNIGGSGYDGARDIAVDALGNIYLTGYYNDNADFDPDTGFVSISSWGGTFVAKYDPWGNYLWATGMGDGHGGGSTNIAVDMEGNVYVTGSYYYFVSYIIFAKYSSTGEFLWEKYISGAAHYFGNSMILDNNGNIYLAGYFDGTADFDPGQGTEDLTSVGEKDVFFGKYSLSVISGFTEKNFDLGISIYPNPSTGQITIEINSALQEPAVLQFIDLFGREIYSESLPVIHSNYQKKLDLSRFAKGVYCVRLLTENGTFTSKIIYQ